MKKFFLIIMGLAVATILVAPLLAHVSSGFETTESSREVVSVQYSADAGVEYALWKLSNDASFRQTLLDNEDTAQSLSLPAHVNAISPTLQVVCVSKQTSGGGGGGGGGGGSAPQTLSWAIWANESDGTASATLNLSGSGHRVNGNIHSNEKFKITGAGHVVSGTAEYVDSYQVSGAGNQFIPGAPNNPVQTSVNTTWPISWTVTDFAPGGTYAVQAQAAGKYYEHSSKWSVSGAGVVVPAGLHYCHGDVSFSGAGLQGISVTVVALGAIDVSGAGINLSPYIPGLTFFTTKNPPSESTNAMSLSGAGNTGGTTFCPNGKISLTGAGGTIIGAFLGERVDISGAGATINLATVYLPATGGGGGGAGDSTCGEYDIQAASGSSTVNVRVTECDGEGLQIRSWTVN